jgi:hypothetical protein
VIGSGLRLHPVISFRPRLVRCWLRRRGGWRSGAIGRGPGGGGAKGPAHPWFVHLINQAWPGRNYMDGQKLQGKSFEISKQEVWDACSTVAVSRCGFAVSRTVT